MTLNNLNSSAPKDFSKPTPSSDESQDSVSPVRTPRQVHHRVGQVLKHSSAYLLAVLLLTLSHGAKYFREPSLSPGDLAPSEYVAPSSDEIIDPVATAQELERVQESAQTLLVFDGEANLTMNEQLVFAFIEGDRLRHEAELAPYLSPTQLSPESQRYLQQLLPEEWERWQRMVGSADSGGVTEEERDGSPREGSPTGNWIPLGTREWELDYSVIFNLEEGSLATGGRNTGENVGSGNLVIPEVQLTTLRELLRLRRALPPITNTPAVEGEAPFAALSARNSPTPAELNQPGLDIPDQFEAVSYRQVLNAITVAQHRYQLVRSQLQGGHWTEEMLQWDEAQWQLLRREAPQALARMQAIGIAEGLPERGLRQGITAQLEDVPEEMHEGAIALLDGIVVSNLRENRQLMQEQLNARLAAVQPVTVTYEANQVIVKRGEPITEELFAVLDHYNLTQRRLNGWGLLDLAGKMAGAVIIVTPVYWLARPRLRGRDRLLLLILISTVAPISSLFGVQYSSLPMVGLLGGSYFGRLWGLLAVIGAAALLPLATPVSGAMVLPGLVSGVLACAAAPKVRSRDGMALLGGGVALTQALTYGAVTLLLGQPFSWAALAVAGGTGLLWSIVALGASPHLESMFDVVTPIRLAELANPNRPLLRRLANEAPGTFQHTLFVASLAERAAQKLGLNVELVRTGTLYHDIGKMVEAEFFIENQLGKPNPHDQIQDPYRSAEIILAHVPDGLRLARQYRLPTAIQAFIPEHQGTIRVAYFYHQAQKQAEEGQPPDESLFRYQGPIPQSRETGIVMLADACEAALRSLRNPEEGEEPVSPAVAKRTIMSIFRNRWEDKQLVDSGLDRADLDVIADVFLQVWRESSHERIRYPQSPI